MVDSRTACGGGLHARGAGAAHRAAHLAALLAALFAAGAGARRASAHSFPVAYSSITVEERALTWDLRAPIDAVLCEIETPGFSRDELLALGPGIVPPLPADPEATIRAGLPLWRSYLGNTLHVLNDDAVAEAAIESFALDSRGGVVFRMRYDWPGSSLGAITIRSSLLLDLDPTFVNLATARRGEKSAQTVLSAAAREWRFDARTLAGFARGSAGGAASEHGGAGSGTGGGAFLRFVQLGSVHILGDLPEFVAAIRGDRAAAARPLGWNYDHLLFVLGLLVAIESLPALVKVATAFTVAHTITLGISAFGIVRIPLAIADVAVALTLVFVGVENLLVRAPRRRPLVAFLLGLVHGFAFSEVLSDLALSKWALAGCLLGFNLGVEICQLGVILAVYPLLALARQERGGARARASESAPAREPAGAVGHGAARALAIRRVGSAFVALAGAFWFFERVAALVAR